MMMKIPMKKTALLTVLALYAGWVSAAGSGQSSTDSDDVPPVVVGKAVYSTAGLPDRQSRRGFEQGDGRAANKDTGRRATVDLKKRLNTLDTKFRQDPYTGYKGSLNPVYRAPYEGTNGDSGGRKPEKERYSGVIRVKNPSHGGSGVDNTLIDDQWYLLTENGGLFNHTWTCMLTGASHTYSSIDAEQNSRYVLVSPKTSQRGSGTAYINPAWGGTERYIKLVNPSSYWMLYGEKWTYATQEVPWICEK